MELICETNDAIFLEHDGHSFLVNKKEVKENSILSAFDKCDQIFVVAFHTTAGTIKPVLKKSLYGEHIINLLDRINR